MRRSVAALIGAPSVLLPEIVIPSADAIAPLSRVYVCRRSVCL